MKPSILPLPILVAATFGCNPDAFAATISGNATLTSDYVWRGSSQTQGDAAVQAGFRVAAAEGLYAAVSGSNVEFSPQVHASSELDVSVGWAGALSPEWSIDANLLHYRYPATTVDLNWTELNTTVTWRRDYWLSLGWSPQALGTRQDGLYSQLGARWPVNERLRLEAMAGYYTLQDARGGGYAHGQLNAIWSVVTPLELRLSAHGTDRRAKTLYGDDLAGTRWEVAVQGAF